MKDNWQERVSCAVQCNQCNKRLGPKDRRFLSVFDHDAICSDCKKAEETRPEYEETSKRMIGDCMAETELLYGDPEGYCLYHFYPFTCEKE